MKGVSTEGSPSRPIKEWIPQEGNRLRRAGMGKYKRGKIKKKKRGNPFNWERNAWVRESKKEREGKATI